MAIAIKDWFMKKVREQNDDAFRAGELETYHVEKETEKAYCFKLLFESRDGESSFTRNVWVPKSCTLEVESVEAYEEQKVEDMLSKFEQARERGLDRYMKLYNFAIENGIKVRKRTKSEKILEAIEEARLVYNY